MNCKICEVKSEIQNLSSDNHLTDTFSEKICIERRKYLYSLKTHEKPPPKPAGKCPEKKYQSSAAYIRQLEQARYDFSLNTRGFNLSEECFL